MSRFIPILAQILLLYLLFLLGTGIQKLFDLFIPGSVIGLILLFILLTTNIVSERWIKLGAGYMIRHLPFFFIPATAGVMSYAYVFKGDGLLLIPIVLFSTVLVMVCSGLVTQWIAGRKEPRDE